MTIVENFYVNLCSNQRELSENIPHIVNQGSEEMSSISEEGIFKLLSEIKNNKAPREGSIVAVAIKMGGGGGVKELLKAITKPHN